MQILIRKLQTIGPGAIIAAAFIGPGTITTCVKAGVENQYSLLWAILFSTISCIFLQQTASKIGIITQQGLGGNIRDSFSNRFIRFFITISIILSIFVGNIAFETGNIVGATMGVQILQPTINPTLCSLIIGGIALVFLVTSTYGNIEKLLKNIVIIMALIFIVLMIIVQPDWSLVLKGLFVPSFGEYGLMTVVGLIGTTIGPYQLFLHASSSAKKWSSPEDIKKSAIDSSLSIGLGGIISISIVIVSAACANHDTQINNASDTVALLTPILGKTSNYFWGMGLFAAGFSSVLTAAMGAACAIDGIWEKSIDKKNNLVYRATCAIVVMVGTIFSVLWRESPTELILLAQVTNAVILPLIVIFLVFCANRKVMGKYSNGIVLNTISLIIFLVCTVISYRNITNFISSFKQLFN